MIVAYQDNGIINALQMTNQSFIIDADCHGHCTFNRPSIISTITKQNNKAFTDLHIDQHAKMLS